VFVGPFDEFQGEGRCAKVGADFPVSAWEIGLFAESVNFPVSGWEIALLPVDGCCFESAVNFPVT
jgi:hypothetical protein